MPALGSAKITIRTADGKTQEYDLGEDDIHIGRDRACDVFIPSVYVSRHHALITLEDGHFVLKNWESRFGMTINGAAVMEPHQLAPGDRVEIGDALLTYEEEADDAFRTALFVRPPPSMAESRPQSLTPAAEAGPRRGRRPAGLWTILFTDIVSNTDTLTRLGDVAGQRWLHEHNEMLRDQFGKHDGLEDKHTGDGFLVTFASARRATQCAVAIQRQLREYNITHPNLEIHVRIGLHTGEILTEGEELFGQAVAFAKRVMDEGNSDEVLISELMYRLIQGSGEFELLDRGLRSLKGFRGRHRLYLVRWQEEPAVNEA